MATMKDTDLRAIAEAGARKARERAEAEQDAMQKKRVQELLQDRQLMLWADPVRGAPNELLRSALFTAKNRKQPRQMLRQAKVAAIGGGRITYTGEELRQDDESVWLQIIHLARQNGLDTEVHFIPRALLQEIGWPISGKSYDRLVACLTRLQATSLQVHGLATRGVSMLPDFVARRPSELKEQQRQGVLESEEVEGIPYWTVKLHPELVLLFSDHQYSRLQWSQRVGLPEGLATWLHGYYSTHADPLPVRVETLAIGAGLLKPLGPEETADSARKAHLREIKRLIGKALESLVAAQFLTGFEISRSSLVTVKRASQKSVRV